MGLISRVSSRTYRNKNTKMLRRFFHKKVQNQINSRRLLSYSINRQQFKIQKGQEDLVESEAQILKKINYDIKQEPIPNQKLAVRRETLLTSFNFGKDEGQRLAKHQQHMSSYEKGLGSFNILGLIFLGLWVYWSYNSYLWVAKGIA